MQEPKAGRRIVSKSAYAKAQSRKLFLCLESIAYLLMSFAVFCFAFRIRHFFFNPTMDRLAYCVYGLACLCAAKRTVYQIRAVEAVTTITRANTADLPAPDSLVRASQEPAQAQEGILLRGASGEAQAGQEGQLLRASAGE